MPRPPIAFFLIGLFLFASGLGSNAQPPKKPVVDGAGRLPADGAETLEKEYREKSTAFRNLAKGDPTANKTAHADLIDVGVKYHLYRLTWQDVTSKPGGAQLLLNQLEMVVNDALRTRPKSNEFLTLFSRQVLVRLKELLNHDEPVVRLNAALTLPLVAKLGNPEMADPLVELLRAEGQNEGVRYWALVALRELFSQARLPTPVGANPVKFRPDQEERCVSALIDYLQRPMDFPDRIVRIQRDLADEKKKDTVPEDEKKELAQYEGGVQLARRAAVRALAEMRYPALPKKTDEIGLTALALLRVVADDLRSGNRAAKKSMGLPPRASLAERVEAVIGLAQLQSALTPEYNPDYAAQYMGRFLVEFATRYNAEKNEKREPWKLHAARVLLALTDMRTELTKRAGADAGRTYAINVITQAEKFLKSMEVGSDPTNHPDLGAWLVTNPPPSKSLYKGIDKAVVKPVESDAQ